ncbi:hypothetical protein EVAR_103067_1 [Eumeta japonica]|uniref:Uncharacterized protein n=1 Tax=Eumeta variegata TaxID=151549 RepID=A0A4C1WQ32_EUMVA|nr:hypothetical protein EVAR_103067_1 [Eumeta japonica]
MKIQRSKNKPVRGLDVAEMTLEIKAVFFCNFLPSRPRRQGRGRLGAVLGAKGGGRACTLKCIYVGARRPRTALFQATSSDPAYALFMNRWCDRKKRTSLILVLMRLCARAGSRHADGLFEFIRLVRVKWVHSLC